MTTDTTLLKFPTEFPLKVMGRNNEEFRSLVLGLVQQHMGAVDASKIEERPSRDGNYLGLTYTVWAESKAQLDELYTALTSNEKVLVVL
jgi:uncharacterized protein